MEVTKKINDLKSYKRRLDFEIVADLVKEGSRVLDLGCANGDLIQLLIEKKKVNAAGVEILEDKVAAAIKKGLSVYHGNIDEGLSDYDDNFFDYIILSQTLQEASNPSFVLNEMLRAGKQVIVSFPNFSYWQMRVKLFFMGKISNTPPLYYQLQQSPNMHMITLSDFRDYCLQNNITILKEIPIHLANQPFASLLTKLHANLFAQYGIYLLKRELSDVPDQQRKDKGFHREDLFLENSILGRKQYLL